MAAEFVRAMRDGWRLMEAKGGAVHGVPDGKV